MPLDTKNFSDISLRDIQELIDNAVPEGKYLEYKASAYGGADKDKKEFLKDVSAFANADGGHLIIGLSENEGVAASVQPIREAVADDHILRLENILRDGIEPRISTYEIKTLSTSNDGHVVIIRVAPSATRPHRVCYGNSNKFYTRNANAVHELDVGELRTLFLLSENRTQMIKSFVRGRVQSLAQGDAPEQIDAQQILLAHIVPIRHFSNLHPLNYEWLHSNMGALHPIAASSMTPRANLEGFRVSYHVGDNVGSYTQLFRDGCVEAAVAGIITLDKGKKFFSGSYFIPRAVSALQQYEKTLLQLGFGPPYAIFISLIGADGSVPYFHNNDPFGFMRDSEHALDQAICILPEILVESTTRADGQPTPLKPLLDLLWNCFGYTYCSYFNSDGNWLPPR